MTLFRFYPLYHSMVFDDWYFLKKSMTPKLRPKKRNKDLPPESEFQNQDDDDDVEEQLEKLFNGKSQKRHPSTNKSVAEEKTVENPIYTKDQLVLIACRLVEFDCLERHRF